MRYRYIFSVGLLLSLSYVCLQAQTRQSAIDRYHDGGQRARAGRLERSHRRLHQGDSNKLAAGGKLSPR